jgi:hypothetical protein
LKYISTFGLPAIQETSFYCPSGIDPESFVFVEAERLGDDSLTNAAGIWTALLSGLGLQGLITDDEAVTDLVAAGLRGVETHRDADNK